MKVFTLLLVLCFSSTVFGDCCCPCYRFPRLHSRLRTDPREHSVIVKNDVVVVEPEPTPIPKPTPELDLPVKFQIYKDHAGQWRWRAKAANNKIIGTSGGDGYHNKADCLHGIHLMQIGGPLAVIEFVEK